MQWQVEVGNGLPLTPTHWTQWVYLLQFWIPPERKTEIVIRGSVTQRRYTYGKWEWKENERDREKGSVNVSCSSSEWESERDFPTLHNVPTMFWRWCGVSLLFLFSQCHRCLSDFLFSSLFSHCFMFAFRHFRWFFTLCHSLSLDWWSLSPQLKKQVSVDLISLSHRVSFSNHFIFMILAFSSFFLSHWLILWFLRT